MLADINVQHLFVVLAERSRRRIPHVLAKETPHKKQVEDYHKFKLERLRYILLINIIVELPLCVSLFVLVRLRLFGSPLFIAIAPFTSLLHKWSSVAMILMSSYEK